MRPLHLGIGLSVVFHGLAVAYALTHPPAHPFPAVPAPQVPITLVESTPIEIVVLPDPAPTVPRAAVPPPPSGAGRATAPDRAPPAVAVTTGRPSVVENRVPVPAQPAPGEGAPSPPGRVSPLAMRTGPQRPEPTYAAAYDLPPGAPPPPATPVSGHLRPVGGGRQESDQDVFTVRVAEDGSVEIEDAPPVQVAWLAPLPIIVGRFDVTDMLMRAQGEDPYAHRKRKILDETREERYAMGVAYKQKQYARTPQIVRKNLERLFATKTDPVELKQALFELWDEAIEAEDPGTESEEAVGAGRVARTLVIGAILTHFPAGSEHAFTEAELAACNRTRTSKSRFAPYD